MTERERKVTVRWRSADVAALVCVWAKKGVNGCPMEKDRFRV